MSARESWTGYRTQREEAMPGRVPALTRAIKAVHRCDRCGAQAYVRVLLCSHQDLLFCAHHYRRHAPALAKVAVEIQDETGRLVRGDWPGSRRCCRQPADGGQGQLEAAHGNAPVRHDRHRVVRRHRRHRGCRRCAHPLLLPVPDGPGPASSRQMGIGLGCRRPPMDKPPVNRGGLRFRGRRSLASAAPGNR
jgi:hypothetical protein